MASTQSLINYYANLLILQYLQKPKAYATIQTLVTPVIMGDGSNPNGQLPLEVQNAFNLLGTNSTTAVGDQLNVLGKYAGVTRTGVGLTGQPITLSDSDFLTLIQIAVISNTAGSSLSTIQALLNQYFAGEILVFDYQNMQMSYLISSTVGSQNLVQLLVTEGLLPKPMAVQLASIIYVPIINAFFGFRTYVLPAVNSSPFNDYTSYDTNWPWISYRDAIGPTYAQYLITESGQVLDTQGGDGIILS